MTIPRFGWVWLIGASLFLAGCGKGEKAGVASQAPARLLATLITDQGEIEIELLAGVAPKAVENFRLLAQRGYYRGTPFHRVIKGFMIQGGDPKGDGSGGESAWGGVFDDEIDKTSPLYRGGYKRGTVALANTGPNTNQSQFFIVHQDFPLHPGYTIFGQVVRGMEVVDAIADAPLTRGPDGNQSKPLKPVLVKDVMVRVAEPVEATPAK